MNKIGEFKGDRDGIVYHVYDGYFYRTNATRDNKTYLICLSKNCPGRASMPTNPKDRILNNFKMTGLHDHPPNVHRIALLDLRRTLKLRSETEFTPLRQIFNEEIAKVPEGVSKLITYNKYRSTMTRARHHVQKVLMSSLQDDVECVEVDTEYTDNPASRDANGELSNLEDQQVITIKSKRKRASRKNSFKHDCKSKQTLLQPDVKKSKLFENHEALETSHFEEVEQTDDMYEDENNDETFHDNQREDSSEGLEQYLQFYTTNPKYKNNQCVDLLSTFFKEMEKTVRSFLPSVIIEAKGRIASLINKLEMKNWQVQQLLEQKEREKQEEQRQTSKPPKQNQQSKQQEELQLKQQQKKLQKQWQLMQQHRQVQIEKKQEDQKLDQYQVHIFNIDKHEIVDEEHEVVDEVADEENEVIDEEFVVDEKYEVIDGEHQGVVEQNLSINEEDQLVFKQHSPVNNNQHHTLYVE